MTKTKIQGKFYPLQHDEWLRACRELTPAQRDVLYFIRAIVLHNQDKPTDLMNVTTWLYDHKLLEKVGGQSKLAQLVNCTVSAINIDQHAALVIDKYLRRQLIHAGNEIAQLGYETSIELETVLEQSEQKVFSVTVQKASERYQLEDASQMAISLFASIETGKRAGELVGWYELEALTGGKHRQTLTVIGGGTSMGKTQVMVGLSHAIFVERSSVYSIFLKPHGIRLPSPVKYNALASVDSQFISLP